MAKVLVVDDNEDFVWSIASLLRDMGHSVEVALDGGRAIERAIDWCPDVVLCDIGLPVADGYQVARALRREQHLQDAKLVAITGYSQPEDIAESKRAGFDLHLSKPPDMSAIAAIVGEGSA